MIFAPGPDGENALRVVRGEIDDEVSEEKESSERPMARLLREASGVSRASYIERP